MRRFEKQGMTREQAEALTEHLTELICANREKIVEQFVSKAALEKVVARQGSHCWLTALLALGCLTKFGSCERVGIAAQLRGWVQPMICWSCPQAVLEQEARTAGFRSEVSKSQELHLASVTRDIERLSTQLEKIKAEIRCAGLCLLEQQLFAGSKAVVADPGSRCCCRYEVDKLTSSQRLGDPPLC